MTSASAGDPAPEADTREVTLMNAAGLYREAFAQLPEGDFTAHHGRLGHDHPDGGAFLDLGRGSLDLKWSGERSG